MPSFIKGRPVLCPTTPTGGALSEAVGKPLTGILPIDPLQHILFARNKAPLRGFRLSNLYGDFDFTSYYDQLVAEFRDEIDIDLVGDGVFYTDNQLSLYGQTPGIFVNAGNFGKSLFTTDHPPPVRALTDVNFPTYFSFKNAANYAPTDETQLTFFIDRTDVDSSSGLQSPATVNTEEEAILSDFLTHATSRPTEYGTITRAGPPPMATVRTLFGL